MKSQIGPLTAAVLAIAIAALPLRPLAAQQASELPVGVGTHFSQDSSGLAPALKLISQAGMRVIRDEVYWGGIETTKGQMTMPSAWDRYIGAALQQGIEPLLVLDYGNKLYEGGNKPRSPDTIAAFVRYAQFVATHFKGKVRRYEVWNEWDNGGGATTPGTEAEYLPLLKAVAPALKKIEPEATVLADAVVLGHGRDDDLRELAASNVLQFANGISVHPYFYNRGRRKNPEAWADWMKDTEAALTEHNDTKPVPLYVTEVGWPTYAGANGVPLGRQAAYAVRLDLLAHTMDFVKLLLWYDFRNDGIKPEGEYDNFGLTWPDLTPKPAYYAVAAANAVLATATFVDRLPGDSADDWVLRFRLAGGLDLWALWTERVDGVARFHLSSSGTNPPALAMQETGRPKLERAWSTEGGQIHLDITAGEMPILLTGNLVGVAIDKVDHLPYPSDLH